MSKIYNFFLDIDGTMLARRKQTLTPKLIEALKFAQSKGSKIFINTGRTKAFVPYELKTLNCFDGLCCGCGTYIEYQGNVLFEHYLTIEQLVRLTDEFINIGVDNDLLFEGYDRMYYAGTGTGWYEENGFIHVKSSDYFKTLCFPPKAHKISTHSKTEKRLEFFSKISDEFYTMHFPNYCETVPIGYDKGKAIQIAEELLSLDHELSVAVGDSLNDAAMLKYAATSVAMGNATEEVKSMCDLVTDTVDNDGVAKLIYDLMK